MTGDVFSRALRSLPSLPLSVCECERIFVIAHLHLRVRVANPRLADVSLRALAHHAVTEPPSSPPDLTIFILDRRAPGNPLLDLPPTAFPSGPGSSDRVERWSYDDAEGRGLLHGGFRALFLWNRVHRRAALWLGEEDDLPYHLVTSPLLPIFSWFLAAHGLAVVHAGAVATTSGAVLLAGRSGTGKSTAALACLSDGLGYVGDDMCIIEPGERPVVHSLFCSGKIDAPDTARFPTLSPALVRGSGDGWEKAVYLFDRHLSHGVVRHAPVVGVAIPRRGAAEIGDRLSPRQGFLAMAPNTVFQLPGAAQAACAGVKEIVSRVPVHPVGIGASIEEIPARVRDYARFLSAGGAVGAWA